MEVFLNAFYEVIMSMTLNPLFYWFLGAVLAVGLSGIIFNSIRGR